MKRYHVSVKVADRFVRTGAQLYQTVLLWAADKDHAKARAVELAASRCYNEPVGNFQTAGFKVIYLYEVQ